VLPLFAIEVWTGFRVASADNVLGAISTSEQPLSVRSPGGEWAFGLALGWFALAYWRRRFHWWEGALVVLGATAALLRAGNAWLDGLMLVVPLGMQLSRVRPVLLVPAAVVGIAVTAAMLWTTRPPSLPPAVAQAVVSTHGTVFSDWRWAPELQHEVAADRRVLPSGGLGSENPAFWLHYAHVMQDHEQWSADLRDLNADVLVLTTDAPDLVRQVRDSSDWQVDYDAGNALVAERVAR
jgi:hypothetical protein